MKIGIISDTHGHMDNRILHHLKDCEQIWHIGDFGNYNAVVLPLKKIAPLKGVYGNIDGRRIHEEFPEIMQFTCEGVNVFMIHIGGYPGRYNKGVKALLKEAKPDIFLSGHSHILKVMADKELNFIHVNPGAAGHVGFHKFRTIITLECNTGKLKNLKVIELGKRGALDEEE